MDTEKETFTKNTTMQHSADRFDIKNIFGQITEQIHTTQTAASELLQRGSRVSCIDSTYQLGISTWENADKQEHMIDQIKEKDFACLLLDVSHTGTPRPIYRNHLHTYSPAQRNAYLWWEMWTEMKQKIRELRASIGDMDWDIDTFFDQLTETLRTTTWGKMKKEMLNEMRRSEADANIARETLMTHLQELLLLFSRLAEEYHIARTPSYSKLYQRLIKKYIKQETDATPPILPYKLLFHRLEEKNELIHQEIDKISDIQGKTHDFTTLDKWNIIKNAENAITQNFEQCMIFLQAICDKYWFDLESKLTPSTQYTNIEK